MENVEKKAGQLLPPVEERIEVFLGERKLQLVEKLGKGRSSQIFLVKDGKGKKLVIKMERPDSTRFRMAERESENLGKANKLGIGPKLIASDNERRIILMEFIQGKTFSEWLFSNPKKTTLKLFVQDLLLQAKALDKIGLDHGQLAGKGANILVRTGKKPKPVIIDFEKASSQRKCHNLRVLEAFLFKNPHGAIAKRVKKILGKKEITF